MRVVLAGYNVDREVLDELKASAPARLDVTPETLSASYARISRDARPADELRRAARAEVEKTRRSNQSIIFKMGHHSVAEHAVFNFDLIGVSRLAIEEIEKFRLCSYTEKSQRYIALGDDFVIPDEIRAAGETDLFIRTVKAQNALYQALYARLKPHIADRYPDLARNSKKHGLLDGWAKEDARYIVSLATEGQLGLTANARNLELMLRRFAAKDLAELRELHQKIHDLAKEVAPSLLLFTGASDFDARTYRELPPAPAGRPLRRKISGDVRLVDFTPRGDDKILAALWHTISDLSYGETLRRVNRLAARAKLALAKQAFARMEFYDFPLREFEYADLTFELTLSASAFAQLKRHRLATLTCQPYDPDLGVTVPPSVDAVGAGREFRDLIDRTGEAHRHLKKKIGPASAYVLTNAHRRRALLKVNVRELYHISRLREDASAQWDIRRLVADMSGLARKAFPLAGLLLGGKDAYPAVYERLYGRKPSAVPPDITK